MDEDLKITYDRDFFEGHIKELAPTAKIIAKLALELVKPDSVVDVGCSVGIFLKEFQNNGCDIMGIDGDWVNEDLLLIPKDKFIRADMEKGFPKLDRRFDLALCLETGEHLGKAHADALVKYLATLSDVVLFGAAIPNQIGVHHVNEQWQSYWAAKFQKLGYVVIDCIRPALWDRKDVLSCYKQNDILYVSSRLAHKYKSSQKLMLDIVHPEYWEHRTNPKTIPIQSIIKALPHIPKRIYKAVK